MDFTLHKYTNICKVSVKKPTSIFETEKVVHIKSNKTDLAFFIQKHKKLF